MSSPGMVDVSKNFQGVHAVTMICMLSVMAGFILNYYYNAIQKIPKLKEKIFYIQIGVNSILGLSVLV